MRMFLGISLILCTSIRSMATEGQRQFEGSYALDHVNSSSKCQEPPSLRIRLSEDGSRVHISNPAGGAYGAYTLENASSGWDDVYDLHMIFEKQRTYFFGLRAWQINQTVSIFGFERETKKFMFLEGAVDQFVIVKRRSFATMSEGLRMKPEEIICAYQKTPKQEQE